MSKLWLFIDKIITAPFYAIGYVVSAAVNTIQHGYHSYEVNYRNAKNGKL